MGLSVDQAVELALAQANEAHLAWDDEQIAQAEARSAGARLLPGLGAEATALFNSPAPGSPGTPSYTSADGVQWYQASVTLQGSVFGGLGAQWKADRALLTAAHAGTEVAKRELAQATVDAWYDLALANASAEDAERNAAAADELAKVTALLFQGGEVAEVDLLRTRLLAASRHDELLQARSEARTAGWGLALLVGADAPPEIAGLPAGAPETGAVEQAMGPAEAPTPALVEAQAREAAAQAGIAAARAAWWPQLGYQAGFGIDTDTLGKGVGDHVGLLVGATLTVPLFDWGIGTREQQSARLAADQAETTRHMVERQAATDRAIAEAQAQSAADRLGALEATLPDAERAADISAHRYQAGEADLVEVTEAQQALVDARAAVNQAQFDYQTALWHLRLLAAP